jgi:hypothetical protein
LSKYTVVSKIETPAEPLNVFEDRLEPVEDHIASLPPDDGELDIFGDVLLEGRQNLYKSTNRTGTGPCAA